MNSLDGGTGIHYEKIFVAHHLKRYVSAIPRQKCSDLPEILHGSSSTEIIRPFCLFGSLFEIGRSKKFALF